MMPLSDWSLGPEWAVLESLCLDLPARDGRAIVGEAITSPDFRWGEFLEQAIRHKILPLASFEILSVESDGTVPKRVLEYLRDALDLNRYRRSMWYREASKVVNALRQQDVAVAGRKDAAFEATLYHSGTRRVGDLDLLISPDDRGAVSETLLSLGYSMGLFDHSTEKVVPFERDELLKYRLHPDHLPVFSLATGDALMPVQEVDVAFCLTWSTSPYQLPVDVALAGVTYQAIPGTDGLSIPCMSTSFQLLDTVMHFFREAWLDWWLEHEQDVDLAKCSDVLRLWRRLEADAATADLQSLIEKYNVAKPIAWVLTHLDRTFHTKMMSSLGLHDEVSEEFLAMAGQSEAVPRVWKGSFRERLFTKDRSGLFEARD